MMLSNIFYALALTMTIFLIVFLLREKKKAKQKRIVYIEDLARIWMSPEDLEEARELLRMQGMSNVSDRYETIDVGFIPDTASVVIMDEPYSDREPLDKTQPAALVPQELFTSERVRDFCATHIVPRQSILTTCKALDPLISILKLLDEKGNCPSLQPRGLDMEEWEESKMELEPLFKITLLDHSLNTCEEIISLKTAQSPKVPAGAGMARLMMAALGHDLGKIPEYFEMYDGKSHKKHSIVSNRVLDDLIPSTYASKEEVLKAVQDHHFYVKTNESDIYLMLRRADADARVKEGRSLGIEYMQTKIDMDRRETVSKQKEAPKQTAKDYRDQPTGLATPDLDWLDPDQLLKELSPLVNMEIDRKFQAFTLGGDDIVYCQLGQISETVVAMAKKAGQGDLAKYQQDIGTRRQLERAIIERMRQKEQITPHVKQGYTANKFKIKFVSNQKDIDGFYTTIYAHKFPDTEANFVARKKGTAVISNIKRVEAT